MFEPKVITLELINGEGKIIVPLKSVTHLTILEPNAGYPYIRYIINYGNKDYATVTSISFEKTRKALGWND